MAASFSASGPQPVDRGIWPSSSRNAPLKICQRYVPFAVLCGLLVMFAVLECFLPLGTAIKIGADEDFELAKAVLSVKGYEFYTEVWNDQPPLYVSLLTQLSKHFPSSVLWPRLMTVGFSILLLSSVYFLALRIHGLLAAALAVVLLIGSPGFLELSCSCMQEIPALAPVAASLCLLLAGLPAKWKVNEVVAGLLLAVGLQLKLIGIIYLPLVVLILWLRGSSLAGPAGESGRGLRGTALRVLMPRFAMFGVSLTLGFLVINCLTGSPLLAQFRQAWEAHFASAQSFEGGSPAEHGFDWSVLPKNWDTTVFAAIGVMALLWTFKDSRQQAGLRRGSSARARQANPALDPLHPTAFAGPATLLPVAWLLLTLLVFGKHKPWWAYYYVHTAVPLCLCAGAGIALLWERICRRGKAWGAVLLGLCLLCATCWMGGRIYLQVIGIRSAPRTYSSLLLKEIGRFKPYTRFLFTDQPIYSFHSGIPVPPHLGVISLKRFWTGDMTQARVVAELDAAKPELILLANDTSESIYQDRINRDYRLVYQDSANRLYAHRSIAGKARYD